MLAASCRIPTPNANWHGSVTRIPHTPRTVVVLEATFFWNTEQSSSSEQLDNNSPSTDVVIAWKLGSIKTENVKGLGPQIIINTPFTCVSVQQDKEFSILWDSPALTAPIHWILTHTPHHFVTTETTFNGFPKPPEERRWGIILLRTIAMEWE